MRHKPLLFRAYYGPCDYMDMPHRLVVGVGLRPDLMTRPEDRGRMTLSVFGFEMVWGCYPESVMRGRPKWFFSACARSDVSEIAERLAGGVE
jgi:hypothetical protein